MGNTLKQSAVRALRDGETSAEIVQTSQNLSSILDGIDLENPADAYRIINDVIGKINNDSASPQEVADAKASVTALVEKIAAHTPKTASRWTRFLEVLVPAGRIETKEEKLASAENLRNILEHAIDALVQRAASEVNPDFKQLVDERNALWAHLEAAEALSKHIADALGGANSAELLETFDLFSKSGGISAVSMFAKEDLMAAVDSIKAEYSRFMKVHASLQKKHITPAPNGGYVFGRSYDVAANFVDQSGMMSLLELEKIDQIGGFLKQMQRQVNNVSGSIQKRFEAAEANVVSATLKIRKKLAI